MCVPVISIAIGRSSRRCASISSATSSAARLIAPHFHDGSAATLADVVVHYNRVRGLGLTAEQQQDLVEYLKSL